MRIFGRDIFIYRYELSRFGELFNPTLLNFCFWLATAAFWFFAYQSVSSRNEEADMSFAQSILPDVFLYFGYLCMACIAYLAITWMCGIRIHKKKTKETHIDIIKDKLDIHKSEIKILKRRLKEAESKNDGSRW